MRLLREFECECGEVMEEYVYAEQEETTCVCGKQAKKKISAPAFFKIGKFRSGIDGDKWARTREKRFIKKMRDEA